MKLEKGAGDGRKMSYKREREGGEAANAMTRQQRR